MDTPVRRPKTINEFKAAHNIGHSTVYEEKESGRLKITKVRGKSLIYPEDEDAWRASLPVLGPKTSAELLEQVPVGDDWRDVIDIAKNFAKAIARLPARKREQLVERFNDLVAERTPKI
jgi:hypothetical protein